MLNKTLLFVFFIVLTWSAIYPKGYAIWFLEVAPALIGFVVLCVTYNTFRLTSLAYILVLIHCVILMVGGHYTYAEVPLFDWIQDYFNHDRNNYDKLGHLAQGFIPVIIAREIVIRKAVFSRAGWRNFFIVCFCLALSAFYELIEWWVATLSGESADAFLATQGYVWDTQSDMGIALLGSILSLITLAKLHDRQLARLGREKMETARKE